MMGCTDQLGTQCVFCGHEGHVEVLPGLSHLGSVKVTLCHMTIDAPMSVSKAL